LKQLAVKPSTETRIAAAINLARVREYDRALQLLREAVKLDPDAAYPRYALGHVLFARAEIAWHKKADAKLMRGWFQEAAEQSSLAAKRRPDDARAYLFWGLSLKYLDQSAAAVDPLQKGVARAPADFELQLALGDVLGNVGKTDEAKVHLENARRLRPADPRPAEVLQRLDKKNN
jgi:Flp pilus assembly protein TadD